VQNCTNQSQQLKYGQSTYTEGCEEGDRVHAKLALLQALTKEAEIIPSICFLMKLLFFSSPLNFQIDFPQNTPGILLAHR
jgi:hypothetical protein